MTTMDSATQDNAAQAAGAGQDALARLRAETPRLRDLTIQAIRANAVEMMGPFASMRQIPELAAQIVAQYLDALSQGLDAAAMQAQLLDWAKRGLGPQGAFAIAETLVQAGMDIDARLAPALNRYRRLFITGYEAVRRTEILREQERMQRSLHSALERQIASEREARIALQRRQTQLEVAAELARRTSMTRDLDELLAVAARELQIAFELDFVGIYLLDDFQTYAVLRAGAGAAGSQLLAQGYHLRLDADSPLRRAADQAGPLLLLDGKLNAASFTQLLLPALTQTVVMRLTGRGHTLGFLTLGSKEREKFASPDLAMLALIADNLAHAIENAQLLAQTQANLQELERAQVGFVRQAWAETAVAKEIVYSQSQDNFAPMPAAETDADNGAAPSGVLSVPVTLRGQVIGTVDLVDTTQTRAWSENDVALASSVVEQMALAVENARLFDQAQQHAQELTAINEIANVIAQELTLDRLYESVREQVSRIMPADAFFVMLYDRASDSAAYPYIFDDGEVHTAPNATRTVRANLRAVIENGNTILLNRTPQEIAAMQARMNVETGIGNVNKASASLMYVPMRRGSEIVGCISAQSYTLNAYTERHTALMEGIANHMVVALQNARLFEATQQRAQETAVINELAREISGELDQDALFEKAYKQLARLMKADAFIVWFYDEASHTVTRPGLYDLGERYPARAEPAPLSPRLEEIVTTNRPFLLNRTRADWEAERQRTENIFGSSDPSASLLFAPLRFGNRTRGIISVQSYDFDAYSEPQEALLVNVANQMAAALENAQLFEGTRQALAETQLFYQISEQLNQVTSLEELVRATAQPAFERGAGSSQLLLLEYGADGAPMAANGVVSLLSSGELVSSGEYTHFSLEQFAIGKTLLANPHEIQSIEDVATNPILDDATREVLLASRTHAVAFLPLTVEQRILGLIVIGWAQPHTFSVQEKRVYQTLAQQMAVVLNNLLLFDQTQEALVETQTLYAVGARLNVATTLQEAMLAASAIGIDAGANSATLMLLETDASNRPEWGVVSARWTKGHEPPPLENTRFQLQTLPIADLWLAHPDEPLLIQDIETDERIGERARALYRYSQVRATALLPLRAGARWVAVQILSWSEPHAFSARDARLYRAVMAQAATAFDNRRLFDQTQEALAETQTLYEIGTRLNAATTLQEALEAAAGPAIVSGAATASLLRVHPDAQGEPSELELVAVWPREASHSSAIGTRFGAENLLGDRSWIERSDEPRLFGDVEAAPDLGAVAKEVYLRRGVKATALLPLKIGARWIGVLSQNWQTPHPFTSRDSRLLRAIMAQAATVLDNRALFEQTQVALQQTQDALVQVQQAQSRLNLQYETAQLLAGAPSFDAVAATLLEMICKTLHWEIGEYWAADHKSQKLVLRQVWGTAAPEIQAFVQDTVGMTFEYAEGFVGAVWSERRPLWSADILADKRFRQARTAREAGLVSAFGFPLYSANKTFGAAIFFSAHPQEFDERMNVTMTGVGRQIAQYMQRREAEMDLENSQAQLSEAMQITHLGSWEYDVAQDTFILTPEFYAMLRTSEGEMGGYAIPASEYVKRFVHPDDISAVTLEMRNAIRTHDPNYEREFDYRAIFGDGASGYMTVRLRVVKDANGRTLRTFGTNLDITERKRAEETMRQQNAYLTALHDTTLGLMRRLDLEELLQNIIARAGELIGTEHGYVHLIEPNGQALRMRVGIGLYRDLIGTIAKPGQGLAGTVWQNSEPIVVNDYQTWQGRLQTTGRSALRAVVGVPLKSGDETVGVLGLASVEEGRAFTAAEIEAVDRFAELAAVALDNAQLHQATQSALEQTQRTAEREKRIAEITDRLYAAPDIELVLRAAAEELQRTTGSKRAVVRLNLKDNGTNGKD